MELFMNVEDKSGFISDLLPSPLLYTAILLCWYTGIPIIKVSSITLETFITVPAGHCTALLMPGHSDEHALAHWL